MELADACARRQAKTDAKCLAARPARAQPAGGGAADAALELGLARVEGVAERGIPGELLAGDRVQLEQPAQEGPGVVTREVPALDERDRVREVGQRQAARKPWAVRAFGGVRRDHELPRGVAAQPPTAPQLLHGFHNLKTRGWPPLPFACLLVKPSDGRARLVWPG